MNNNQNYWDKKHSQDYRHATWVTKPNYFAQDSKKYFPAEGRLLELGCGQGQDSAYFLSEGYEVVATDFSNTSLEDVKQKFSGKENFSSEFIDLSDATFPFSEEHFDGVYAHLSLHYFTREITEKIIEEIHRVLKPNGVLAFLVNSLRDPECGKGQQLDEDFFHTPAGIDKRFFSPETVVPYISGKFETLLLDEKGQTEKDKLEGDYGLIRFVGRRI